MISPKGYLRKKKITKGLLKRRKRRFQLRKEFLKSLDIDIMKDDGNEFWNNP